MKKLLGAIPVAIATMLFAVAGKANAQTVVLNGIGSSALFLEAGLGTSVAPISAACFWTSNNTPADSNVVTATDTKNSPAVTDTGNAWVAWTKGTGGSCTAPASDAKIYSYLQTDSVVGDRCMFNANAATPTCSISYPLSVPASSGLLSTADSSITETPLPNSIAAALTSSTVNYSGTDIRPEDAEFAVTRATTSPCAAVIDNQSGQPTQYLGLGYNPASTNGNLTNVKSFFSTSLFHTTLFTLPATYQVTPIGATPIVVAVNGFSGITNITSPTLALFLDGTDSFTAQASGGGPTGSPVTVLIREPLSGTYNTMEYNVPNRLEIVGPPIEFGTSQDVGKTQPAAQQVCNPGTGAPFNPLNIATPSGGHRRRAIGTGQELAEVLDTTNNGANILGYGFWSAANYLPFASSTTTHYLTVDGIDPLRSTSVSGNPIPTTTAALDNVTLSNVQNGSYPIWSLIRFVTVSTTAQSNAQMLASATQQFVQFGGTSPRPDFIVASNLTVVRSHFLPPAGTTQPTDISDGTVGHSTDSFCSANEAGGDVGGVVMTLTADSTFCLDNNVTTGNINQRR
jgi:hypothetical protein